MSAIDPKDTQFHEIPLWAVTVTHKGLAGMQCLKFRMNDGKPTAWGYSEWRRSPAFRTLGIGLEEFMANHEGCQFFTNHGEALDALRLATTPSSRLVKEMLQEKKADDRRREYDAQMFGSQP